MANYKEMYLKMARASEQAINILIQAQQEAENIYISESEADIRLFQRADIETIQSEEAEG